MDFVKNLRGGQKFEGGQHLGAIFTPPAELFPNLLVI